MTYSLNTLNNDPRQPGGEGDPQPTGFRRFAQEIALTAGFVFLTFWFLWFLVGHLCLLVQCRMLLFLNVQLQLIIALLGVSYSQLVQYVGRLIDRRLKRH